MAKTKTKRGAAKVQATATPRKRVGKAVRLDLTPRDHQRLERAARARGLTMASYARMTLLERLKTDDEAKES
jgi:hypothetical protein